jgi:hypothetical protein
LYFFGRVDLTWGTRAMPHGFVDIRWLASVRVCASLIHGPCAIRLSSAILGKSDEAALNLLHLSFSALLRPTQDSSIDGAIL